MASYTARKSSHVHYDLFSRIKTSAASLLSLIRLHMEADGLCPKAFLIQEVRVAAVARERLLLSVTLACRAKPYCAHSRLTRPE